MIAAALLTGLAAAVPHHETLTFTEAEFKHLGFAAPTERVRFSAALPYAPGAAALIDERLAALSTPSSPEYGAWMTQAEVNALTAPPPAARAAAAAALLAAGASCTHLPHSLACTAPVAAANALFSSRISAFAHAARGGARVLRVHPTDAYAFPDALRGSVEFFTNLVDFPTERRKLGGAAAFGKDGKALRGGAVDYSILPESLAAIYGAVPAAAAGSAASFAPIEFQGDAGFVPADLSTFAVAAGFAPWNISHTMCVGFFCVFLLCCRL